MFRRLQWSLLFVLAALLLGAAPASTQSVSADDPATAHLRKLFGALADSDPALRQAARDSLMLMGAADLPLLQRIVEQSGDLQPGQRAALHEIVCQVYMAGQPYSGDDLSGFMGVHVGPAEFEGHCLGVEIIERLPGFCGYACFHNGDIITALVSDPPLELLDPNDLIILVTHNFRAGQFLVFDVLRQGNHVHVLVRLMPHPLEDARTLSTTRSAEAEQYWEAHFSPLLEGDEYDADQPQDPAKVYHPG